MNRIKLLFAAAAAIAPLSAMSQWSDNFDGYVTGSQLHGQVGWKGWFNDPNSGALTSGLQFVSSPNSVDINGATDLVHEYVASGGLWTYSGRVYVPIAHTGTSYFILMSNYNDANTNMHWSVQMTLNGTTCLVSDDQTNGGMVTPVPLVKGQWVPFSVTIDLVADTKVVTYNGQQVLAARWRYYAGGTDGQTLSIGAVDLYANGTSSVYYDDLALTAVPQLTPAEAIDALIDLVIAMGLPNNLTDPLHNASDLLTDGNPNNDGAVGGKLDAFIAQVGANPQVTPAQAIALLLAANAIKASLGF